MSANITNSLLTVFGEGYNTNADDSGQGEIEYDYYTEDVDTDGTYYIALYNGIASILNALGTDVNAIKASGGNIVNRGYLDLLRDRMLELYPNGLLPVYYRSGVTYLPEKAIRSVHLWATFYNPLNHIDIFEGKTQFIPDNLIYNNHTYAPIITEPPEGFYFNEHFYVYKTTTKEDIEFSISTYNNGVETQYVRNGRIHFTNTRTQPLYCALLFYGKYDNMPTYTITESPDLLTHIIKSTSDDEYADIYLFISDNRPLSSESSYFRVLTNYEGKMTGLYMRNGNITDLGENTGIPEIEGRVFDGWYIDKNEIAPNEIANLFIGYSRPGYTVSPGDTVTIHTSIPIKFSDPQHYPGDATRFLMWTACYMNKPNSWDESVDSIESNYGDFSLQQGASYPESNIELNKTFPSWPVTEITSPGPEGPGGPSYLDDYGRKVAIAINDVYMEGSHISQAQAQTGQRGNE
jgi:hypothetical protein